CVYLNKSQEGRGGVVMTRTVVPTKARVRLMEQISKGQVWISTYGFARFDEGGPYGRVVTTQVNALRAARWVKHPPDDDRHRWSKAALTGAGVELLIELAANQGEAPHA